MTEKNMLFVLGAPKSGTTKLVHDLNYHPNISCSNPKETNYYSKDSIKRKNLYYKEWICQNEDDYNNCFEDSHKTLARCDGSVSYFDSDTAPLLIKKNHPNAKFIIILRNPIDRAISHYSMDYRLGYFDGTIINALHKKDSNHYHQYFGISKYSKFVKRYVDLFGIKNIKIFSFDYFCSNYNEVLDEIYNFIGVQKIDYIENPDGMNEALDISNKFLKHMYKVSILRKFARTFIPTSITKKIKKVYFKKSNNHNINIQEQKLIYDELKDDYNELLCFLERYDVESLPKL